MKNATTQHKLSCQVICVIFNDTDYGIVIKCAFMHFCWGTEPNVIFAITPRKPTLLFSMEEGDVTV